VHDEWAWPIFEMLPIELAMELKARTFLWCWERTSPCDSHPRCFDLPESWPMEGCIGFPQPSPVIAVPGSVDDEDLLWESAFRPRIPCFGPHLVCKTSYSHPVTLPW
jgi:hypothetical protein